VKYKILADYAERLEKPVNELAAQGYTIFKVLQQDDCGTHICIIMSKEEQAQPCTVRELLNQAYKDGVWSTWVDKDGKTTILHSISQCFTKEGEGIVAIYQDGDERVHLLSDYGNTWALTADELY